MRQYLYTVPLLLGSKNASIALKSLNSIPPGIEEDLLHTGRKLYEGIFPVITEFNGKALQEATYY